MRLIFERLSSAKTLTFIAFCAMAVLAVCAVWQGNLNQDEGWYLYAAQLVKEGMLPYRDFFFTQGPTMPVIYSFLSPIWTNEASILHGVLGGRVVTLLIGIISILLAAAIVWKLVAKELRVYAAIGVFSLLACNLYHLYFNAIPKTYALGSMFVMAGFLHLLIGIDRSGNRPLHMRIAILITSGIFFAFASGTRISLALIPIIVGIVLLFAVREYRLDFLWFGLGAALGLFLTYGIFALDSESLNGLLAAMKYHAARGRFDLFFSLGSSSRLVLSYLGVFSLAAIAVICLCFGKRASTWGALGSLPVKVIFGSFLAVSILQFSAPFPYDDYQVPIMPLLAITVIAVIASKIDGENRLLKMRALTVFAILVTFLTSFSSPLLQQWWMAGQDRFWHIRKDSSDLAKLRQAALALEVIDPGGKTLLTQDLYLAVESGRKVPKGFEMGPFSYFPDMTLEDARSIHVLSKQDLEDKLLTADCSVAALSGYSFAISAPTTKQIPFEEQLRLCGLVKRNYELVTTFPGFGQNSTTLLLLKHK